MPNTKLALGCLLLFLSALTLACGERADPKEATRRAIDALDRLNERRDAGILLYEPRYLDAEKAVAELGDPYQRTMAGFCIAAFANRRKLLEILQEDEDLRNQKLVTEVLADLKTSGEDIDGQIRMLRVKLL
jgi:hypothetical protein